jgi:hypothetical protein
LDGYYLIDIDDKSHYEPILRCEFIDTLDSTSPSLLKFTDDEPHDEPHDDPETDEDNQSEDVPLMSSKSYEKRLNNNSDLSRDGRDLENNNVSSFEDMMTW